VQTWLCGTEAAPPRQETGATPLCVAEWRGPARPGGGRAGSLVLPPTYEEFAVRVTGQVPPDVAGGAAQRGW